MEKEKKSMKVDRDKLLLCMVRTCINFMDLADKAPVSRAALPHLPAYMDGQERGPLYGTR
ncbi:MAG TPA: hypothetical protein H9684_05900 [Firmicutes bacterium]|nr:hypothetical protein [Bacillota bacterium]